jgi:dihydroorotase
MADFSRRCFLGLSAAFPWASGISLPAADPYDLVIAGGRVFDAARGVDGVMDVAVRGDSIASVGPDLAAGAKRTFDARGAIVTPGLIDIHGHVYDDGIPTSIDPDLVGIPRGVTTIVDAGSSGAFTFPGFRKYVIARSKTRVRALINISSIGLVVQNEMYIDPKLIDGKATTRMIEDNPGLILGIKVRINGRDAEVDHDAGVLTVARDVSSAAGVPIMMHWSNHPRLLGMLKKGDILTHPYNPPRSGPNLLGPDGKVLPQILELKSRGIYTDFAHGNHLLWETAEKAAANGWFPDTISTDIHRAHAAPNGNVIDLVTTLSKFLYLGMPLERVLEAVTAAPARELTFGERIGTLEPGAVADISVLRIENASFELRDSTRQARTAKQRVTPTAVVRAGVLSQLG